MNFDEAVAYLLSLGHEVLTMKLGLANIERLLEALGNPQGKFASVQIAGTNGKGSTAAMVDSICHAAKIKRGLYTSPHLVSITERIRINGQEISREAFARLTETVKETAATLVARGELGTLPTFFEHLTAIALLAFRRRGVKLAILETGLGGRLDATTAARAQIVALTPIAMDHQEYLGETLREIASEKAAIIYPGARVIVGPQEPEALEVIMRQCDAAGVKPTLVDRIAHYDGSRDNGKLIVSFQTSHNRYGPVLLGLRGRHQQINASVAIGVVEELKTRGFEISKEAIRAGLESAKHPGRLELLERRPQILLDGAHNPAAARALRDYLDEFIREPVTLVFGAMRDKDNSEMLASLAPVAKTVVLTTFANARAASLESLSKARPSTLPAERVTLADSPEAALRAAFACTAPHGIICVTGSLYLVGEVKKIVADNNDFKL
ncbi:MAG: dihydrofolate synthase / folylpolyglutamate synthase [Blastocatellia bacterium]|jgi:dihydrofolate synthase/folylpolyglutamate synthase|nr:dihydrofolate synthase / folylpolyglutamate synthase [Blastocatellia bacterium]